MLVSVDDSGSTHTEFVCLDVFRWELCTLDAGELECTDDLLNQFATRLASLTEENEGLPLAVRLVVTGRSAIHQKLVSECSSVTNQLRATALDVSGGSVWLEKVKLSTQPQRTLMEAAVADGPLSELLRHCQELQTSDEQIHELAAELADLKRKLPDELSRDEDGLPLDDPKRLREMLPDVQALLVGRLEEESPA
jgi:hypothetical protein